MVRRAATAFAQAWREQEPAAVMLVLVHHGLTTRTRPPELWTEVLEAGQLVA